jgi:anti-anti-sigma regulatory factor
MTGNHACVVYDDESHLVDTVAGYLSEGLDRGEQVGYFGWGTPAALRGRLGGLGDVERLVERHGVVVTSLDAYYLRQAVPDATVRHAFWSDATARALDRGFSGLRVVTETTPWLALPDQRRVFLEGEQVLTGYGRDHPFKMMCVCEHAVLDDEGLNELLAVHAATPGRGVPFRFHTDAAADVRLEGEVDGFSAPVFERLLDALPPAGPHVVVDATALAFIDHTSLLALERQAMRAGWDGIVLRGAAPLVAHLIDLLELTRIGVEDPR